MLLNWLNFFLLFRIVRMPLMVLFLSSCTHTIAFQELNYDLPINKKSENIIVVIDKSTLESAVSTRSATTGIIHRWDAQPGKMLKQAADIEFPQMYNEYIFSNTIIEPPWKENTYLMVMTVPEYQFKNEHAYYTVRIVVYDESSKLMEKNYKEEGINQGSKMFWAGAFGMKSAIRQSSLDALKKIFKHIRIDLSNLVELKSSKIYDEDVNEYYSPQDSFDERESEYHSPQGPVDSFDVGEREYYSPQGLEDLFDGGESEYYSPQEIDNSFDYDVGKN